MRKVVIGLVLFFISVIPVQAHQDHGGDQIVHGISNSLVFTMVAFGFILLGVLAGYLQSRSQDFN